MEYYLLLGRMLVAIALLTLNFYALIAERLTVVRHTHLLSTRPIARAAMRMLWWLCFTQTICILGVTVGAGLRDFYAGEAFVRESPTFVVYVTIAQTLLFYAILAAPAIALLNIMSAVREAARDHELEEARREGWLAKEGECPDCPEHVQRQHHPERFADEGLESAREEERHSTATRHEDERHEETTRHERERHNPEPSG